MMPEDFYLDEELKKMAEDALTTFKIIWKKDCVVRSEEYQESFKNELLEIYRSFNLIFGRQDPKKEQAYFKRMEAMLKS